MQNSRYNRTKISFSLTGPFLFIIILVICAFFVSDDLRGKVSSAISNTDNAVNGAASSTVFKLTNE